jgi:hypothetical protein
MYAQKDLGPDPTTTTTPATNRLGLRPAEDVPPEFSPRDLAFMAALDLAAKMLGARIFALVGIIGAGVLAWRMEAEPNIDKLGVLGIYLVGVAAAVWFSSK